MEIGSAFRSCIVKLPRILENWSEEIGRFGSRFNVLRLWFAGRPSKAWEVFALNFVSFWIGEMWQRIAGHYSFWFEPTILASFRSSSCVHQFSPSTRGGGHSRSAKADRNDDDVSTQSWRGPKSTQLFCPSCDSQCP